MVTRHSYKESFEEEPLALTAAVKLTKDLKAASQSLGRIQGRFLVQQYYTVQLNRIAARNQGKKLAEQDKPYELIRYVGDQMELIELQIKNSLDQWTSNSTLGNWLRAIVGIGPVIAAGLLAHLDIEKAPTAGSFMRFAGIDPTCKWNKGEKRPWNAELKVLLVFKAMESFVKVQNNKNDFYGHLFVTYKKKLTEANVSGAFKERAAELLVLKKYKKDTDVYKEMAEGRLCKAHIHAMARRKVAKLFISHLHEVMYWEFYGKVGPIPYPIVHMPLHHVHYIDVPNMQMFPGMAEARKAQLLALGKDIGIVSEPSQLEKYVNADDTDLQVSLEDEGE